MATRTISNAGGATSTTAAWAEAAVPTASDDVTATASSGNVTIDAALSSQSADLTSYVGTITWNAAWTVGRNTAGSFAFKLGASTGIAGGTGTASALTFTGGASMTMTVTLNGKQVPGSISAAASNVPITFADTVSCSGNMNVDRGAWTLSNRTVTCAQFNAGAALTRTITLTNATVNCSTWAFTGTSNLTWAATGSTINVSSTSASFASQGQTFATVNFTGTTGTKTITGAITATTVSWYAKLVLPASTTAAIGTLSPQGATAAAHAQLASSTPGTAATWSSATGGTLTNVEVVDIATGGGGTFVAQNGAVRGASSGWSALRSSQPAAAGAGR